MNVLNFIPFESIDGSLSKTSQTIDISQLSSVSVQYITTGTLVGTIQIQVSNESDRPTRWATPTTININGVANNVAIYSYGVKWIQFVYTAVSGAGTATIAILGQGP